MSEKGQKSDMRWHSSDVRFHSTSDVDQRGFDVRKVPTAEGANGTTQKAP
jgi:hypothetical protein